MGRRNQQPINVNVRNLNVHNYPQQPAPQQQPLPKPPRNRVVPILAGIGAGLAGAYVGYMGGEIAYSILRSAQLNEVASWAPYVGTLFGGAWAGTSAYTNSYRCFNP